MQAQTVAAYKSSSNTNKIIFEIDYSCFCRKNGVLFHSAFQYT